jgi:hypothetical protein
MLRRGPEASALGHQQSLISLPLDRLLSGAHQPLDDQSSELAVLNVCFHRKQSLVDAKTDGFQGQETAKSGPFGALG